jgi:hypothetical protein
LSQICRLPEENQYLASTQNLKKAANLGWVDGMDDHKHQKFHIKGVLHDF